MGLQTEREVAPGQGQPLQWYNYHSPTHCRIIFYLSDTKQWNSSKERDTMGEKRQKKWKRTASKLEAVVQMETRKIRGRCLSPVCFFQTQPSNVWKVMNQGPQARTGATRLNCMTWGTDGKLEQREGKQRKLSDFCGHYHAVCALHKTFITEDASLLWFGIQNLDQI